ncbi:glycosyltransferase family 2 protein [Confluentibacter flavum]|uniref:Glycosyltransferase family 2 protein n=1 Tax=Confluentibacter flavum TaxID=1909700 RepID=A0A2N3HP36_9FLAO|nr:glycosyltransferase [Confluentibacter flavum]PKQ46715.1 glycosyltransferase family 2 protein [Confluentibacter flavum]
MNKPLVSICIPTFNGASFIEDALKSALAQTYSNIEIVVSDDASKDATLQIIESYKKKTHIPIQVHHHNPSGIGANWNHCIKQANGDYIKFLFQDDVLEPHCVEKMVALAEGSKNVGLVYCKRQIIFDSNKNFDTAWVKNFRSLHLDWESLEIKQGTLDGKVYLKDKKLLDKPENKIGEPTAVLLHKRCFDRVGYFNTHLSQALDIEYWYRLMPYFKIGFIDEELIKFRLHDAQASQVNRNIKIKDKRLLPRLLLQTIFWKLHSVQQKKLLKEVFYFTEISSFMRKVKRKLNF